MADVPAGNIFVYFAHGNANTCISSVGTMPWGQNQYGRSVVDDRDHLGQEKFTNGQKKLGIIVFFHTPAIMPGPNEKEDRVIIIGDQSVVKAR